MLSHNTLSLSNESIETKILEQAVSEATIYSYVNGKITGLKYICQDEGEEIYVTKTIKVQ